MQGEQGKFCFVYVADCLARRKGTRSVGGRRIVIRRRSFRWSFCLDFERIHQQNPTLTQIELSFIHQLRASQPQIKPSTNQSSKKTNAFHSPHHPGLRRLRPRGRQQLLVIKRHVRNRYDENRHSDTNRHGHDDRDKDRQQDGDQNSRSHERERCSISIYFLSPRLIDRKCSSSKCFWIVVFLARGCGCDFVPRCRGRRNNRWDGCDGNLLGVVACEVCVRE